MFLSGKLRLTKFYFKYNFSPFLVTTVFSGSHLVVRVCFVRSGTAAARLMRGLKQMMARRRVPPRGWRGWNSVLRLAGVSPGPASLDGLGAYVKRLNTHTIDPAIPPPGM